MHSLISYLRHAFPHTLRWRHDVTEEYHGKIYNGKYDTREWVRKRLKLQTGVQTNDYF